MLGSDLPLWRAELGLSQPYAAKLLGISVSTLRQYEYAPTETLPRPVAFACAALKTGLMPYRATRGEQGEIERVLAESQEVRTGPAPAGLQRPKKSGHER